MRVTLGHYQVGTSIKSPLCDCDNGVHLPYRGNGVSCVHDPSLGLLSCSSYQYHCSAGRFLTSIQFFRILPRQFHWCHSATIAAMLLSNRGVCSMFSPSSSPNDRNGLHMVLR